MNPPPDTTRLRDALHRRLEIIGDNAWRDRDPAGQLAALQDISRTIFSLEAELAPSLPPRLRHFLESQSYSKALALLE